MGNFLLRGLGCVLFLLSSVASAHAEESPPPPPGEQSAEAETTGELAPAASDEEPSPVEKVEDDLRFRFGIQGGLTAGSARGGSGDTEVSAAVVSLSLGVELGVQTSRHFGLFARGEVASVVFTNQAALYLMAEYTPIASLSLGLGAGVDGFMIFWVGGSNVSPAWSGVSVPVSVAFNLTQAKAFERGGRRAPLRLQFIAAPGINPESGIFGIRGSVGFGAVWM